MKTKEYLPVEGDGATHLKFTVWYDKGGANCFTGSVDPRGIYMSAAPVTLEPWQGSTIERATLFRGRKVLVEGLNRYSLKKFEAWAAVLLRDLAARQGRAWALAEQVAREQGLALPEGVPA